MRCAWWHEGITYTSNIYTLLFTREQLYEPLKSSPSEWCLRAVIRRKCYIVRLLYSFYFTLYKVSFVAMVNTVFVWQFVPCLNAVSLTLFPLEHKCFCAWNLRSCGYCEPRTTFLSYYKAPFVVNKVSHSTVGGTYGMRLCLEAQRNHCSSHYPLFSKLVASQTTPTSKATLVLRFIPSSTCRTALKHHTFSL